MPTFKDINSFVQKTPDGTEKIQVSATQYVTLQQIANLASIPDADIMGKKLVGFTRAPWAKYYPETNDLTANSTLLTAIKAIISSLNPVVDGFTFRIASHSDMDTGAIFQMCSNNNDVFGNIIWNATNNIWGFSYSLIEDQDQADAAIEGVGSTFSFSGKPWTSKTLSDYLQGGGTVNINQPNVFIHDSLETLYDNGASIAVNFSNLASQDSIILLLEDTGDDYWEQVVSSNAKIRAYGDPAGTIKIHHLGHYEAVNNTEDTRSLLILIQKLNPTLVVVTYSVYTNL